MKKYILIVLFYIPSMLALTIINKSELPAAITQITLPVHDGLEKTASIKQTHIPIAPQETVDLAKQTRALMHVIALTLTFNSTYHYFTMTPPYTDGYIIIENEKTIQVSPEISRAPQGPETHPKAKNSDFGPRLI